MNFTFEASFFHLFFHDPPHLRLRLDATSKKTKTFAKANGDVGDVEEEKKW